MDNKSDDQLLIIQAMITDSRKNYDDKLNNMALRLTNKTLNLTNITLTWQAHGTYQKYDAS